MLDHPAELTGEALQRAATASTVGVDATMTQLRTKVRSFREQELHIRRFRTSGRALSTAAIAVVTGAMGLSTSVVRGEEISAQWLVPQPGGYWTQGSNWSTHPNYPNNGT